MNGGNMPAGGNDSNQGDMTPTNENSEQNGDEKQEMTRPDGTNTKNGETPPDKLDGENKTDMSERPNGENSPDRQDGNNMNENGQNEGTGESSTEVTVTAQTHTFNNVSNYTESSQAGTKGVKQNSDGKSESDNTNTVKADSSDQITVAGILPNTGMTIIKIGIVF